MLYCIAPGQEAAALLSRSARLSRARSGTAKAAIENQKPPLSDLDSRLLIREILTIIVPSPYNKHYLL